MWPSPWREAILDCIERRADIGTPIAEYVPDQLVDGRLALVGDVAAQALRGYERERLSSVRSMVQSGQQFSRSFTGLAA